MSSTDFPSDPGIWAWDGTSCLWVRTNGVPFPTGVTGVYGWDGGGQRWVLVDGSGGDGEMGVTDGSDAAPGRVGEYIGLANAGPNVQTVLADPTLDSEYTTVVSFTLSAGDWDVNARVYMELLGTTSSYIAAYLGRATLGGNDPDSSWFELRGVTAQDVSAALGPVRISASTPTLVVVRAVIVAPIVTSATSSYQVHVRRVR